MGTALEDLLDEKIVATAALPRVEVTPLEDRVLVRRLHPGEIKRGSIIIPDVATDPPQEAEVLAVGEGRVTDSGERIPVRVQPGEKVLIGKYVGVAVKVNGEEQVLLREDDILARVREVG